MPEVIVIDLATLGDLIDAAVGRHVAGLRDAIASLRPAPAPEPDDRALLTTAQLCELLQVDKRTLRRMEALAELPPAIRIGAKVVRWRRSVIDAWLRKSTSVPHRALSIVGASCSVSRVRRGAPNGESA